MPYHCIILDPRSWVLLQTGAKLVTKCILFCNIFDETSLWFFSCMFNSGGGKPSFYNKLWAFHALPLILSISLGCTCLQICQMVVEHRQCRSYGAGVRLQQMYLCIFRCSSSEFLQLSSLHLHIRFICIRQKPTTAFCVLHTYLIVAAEGLYLKTMQTRQL